MKEPNESHLWFSKPNLIRLVIGRVVNILDILIGLFAQFILYNAENDCFDLIDHLLILEAVQIFESLIELGVECFFVIFLLREHFLEVLNHDGRTVPPYLPLTLAYLFNGHLDLVVLLFVYYLLRDE